MRGFALHYSGGELRARERGSEAQSNRGREGEGAVFATNGESGAERPLGETAVVVQWFRMVGCGDRVTSTRRGHLVTLAGGRAGLGTGTRVFLLCHSTPWRRSRMD